MPSISSSLNSVAQSMLGVGQVNRTMDMTQTNSTAATTATTNPTSASTTVTLSSGQPQGMVDYLGLNNQQMVRNTTQTMQSDTNGNQTTSGMTYSSSLQNERAYLMSQQAQSNQQMQQNQNMNQNMNQNSSGNTMESTGTQNANLASSM